jgi:2-(1,2-epoxy-1,2-dihydrophenyl)acetyl-CoA isomerase
MSEAFLKVDVEAGLARVTLCAAARGNALDLAASQALLKAAIVIEHDPSVRCVLLSAEGPMFSVGGDLGAFAGFGADVAPALSEMTVNLHGALSRMARMPVPLVVAVQGPAAGAGMSLAMLGDIVIASLTASFTAAYTAAGLTPDGGMSYLLPKLCGLRRAQELILTNRRVLAEEALALGLVTRLAEPEALMAESEALARKLVAGPTRAFGRVRSLLLASHAQSYDSHLEAEARSIVESAAAPDGQEGMAAFLARRKPVFTGQ